MSGPKSPRYLRADCPDSQVPANTIVGRPSGEVFVHRGLANLIGQADVNGTSVMQFAIDVLEVRRVVVCGHYGCSGVRAVKLGDCVGLGDKGTAQIRSASAEHPHEPEQARGTEAHHRLLSELDAIEHVANACETAARDAWSRGRPLTVPHLVSGLEDGCDHEFSCRGPVRH